ncbi:MAG: thiamine phosphate synthase [Gammaproteobacteria bacterium]|nr:thiamine phosphate synthase [Gammaproteobacteria bacterium]
MILHGLYAITQTLPKPIEETVNQVDLALGGGARVIQYRDKSGDPQKRREEALRLLALCKNSGVPLIINDDVDLASEIGADGVHLGRNDDDPEGARERLGPTSIIGVSCYNQFELAVQAQAAGADYVAFGRFFPSSTKPQAVQASHGLLRRARAELKIPTVAIGGITPENGRYLIAAGADMLAAIEGIFGQADIPRACGNFTRLFSSTEASKT